MQRPLHAGSQPRTREMAVNDGYMNADAVEDKLSRIEERRALGEAQADIETVTGKPVQPTPQEVAKRADKQRKEIAHNISADRLRSLVERIERLEEERKALAGDIKDIFAEAKSAGFDVKVIRQIIRIRAQEPAEVEEQETLLDVYRRALGM